MAHKIPNNRTMGVMYGRALIQPATIDVQSREFDVVFITETIVPRFGWTEDYDELLVCEQSAIRMDRANRGLPVLDCHRADSVHNQLGRTTKVWINDQKELCARVRFSQRPELAGLFQDIVEGIVKDISGGYEIYKYEREERQGGLRPLYRAVDWMPTELSFAPVQADIKSEIRGLAEHNVEIIEKQTINLSNMQNKRSTEPGKTTQYTVEGDPVKAGDIVTVDDVKGVALTDGDVGDTITLTIIENDTADNDGNDGGDGSGADADADAGTAEGRNATGNDDTAKAVADAAAVAGRAAGISADSGVRKRIEAIQQMARAAGLSDSYALALAKTDLTEDQCSRAIMRRLAQRSKGVNGTHGISVGLDSDTKKRTGIENALLNRIYPAKFKLDDGAREFRSMTMLEIGKVMLNERGINTRSMGKTEIAEMFFSRSQSTSDFPQLFGGIISRMLREQYDYAPEYWDKIARQTTVDDFRAKGIYTAGVVSGMKEIKEGGELKYTQLKASDDKIQVATFGEGIRYTRQAFINDDLGVFSLIPTAFVRHWNTLRGNKVWGLITGNVKMSDNVTLFHSDHGNLITGANSALSEASLAAAKTALSKQKDVAGDLIRILPRYLVVPPELEMLAKKLVTATTPAKAEDVNVFGGAFDVIVEPRLNDPTSWYLMADPYAVDALYYAYLDGNEGLRVNSTEEFKTDSMDYAVRGDFGTAAIDYRGIVKSKGKA